MNKTLREENKINKYYTGPGELTLLQLMAVLALLGISLTCLLRYFLS